MPSESMLQIILLNAYYAGVAVAFLVKDILWLRVIMILAGICMILQAIMAANKFIISWISLFVVINTIQIIRILHENREIKLEPELLRIYQLVFTDMTKKEFRLLWNMGKTSEVKKDELFCADGLVLNKLILITRGRARVLKSNKPVADLITGNFIAEMSFLTGKVPSADVVALENTFCIIWHLNILNRLKELYPNIYNKLQLILSKDLTEKLKRYL
ncbi:MAG: cyclic nucleotide-binding domain-containing protein [Candidatus Cloacimonetes bacterium]|nr:cyclic nucleotide-binding domain-containing protein [Candidatus Cloacimonadota bacterium]